MGNKNVKTDLKNTKLETQESKNALDVDFSKIPPKYHVLVRGILTECSEKLVKATKNYLVECKEFYYIALYVELATVVEPASTMSLSEIDRSTREILTFEKHFVQYLETNRDSLDAMLMGLYATHLYTVQNFDQANQWAKNSLKIDPTEYSGCFVMAKISEHQKNYKLALEYSLRPICSGAHYPENYELATLVSKHHLQVDLVNALKILGKENAKLKAELAESKAKYEELYYCPGKPGAEQAQQDFQTCLLNLSRNSQNLLGQDSLKQEQEQEQDLSTQDLSTHGNVICAIEATTSPKGIVYHMILIHT